MLTTGVVGFGDSLPVVDGNTTSGGSNITRLRAMSRNDSIILKPSHPALRLDLRSIGHTAEQRQVFVAPCVPARVGKNASTDRRANSLARLANVDGSASAAERWWYTLLATELNTTQTIVPAMLFPVPPANQRFVVHEFGTACVHGAPAASCLSPFAATAPLNATTAFCPCPTPRCGQMGTAGTWGSCSKPACNLPNAGKVSTGCRYWSLYSVAPVLAGGYALLGDQSKYVSVSPQRFVTARATTATSEGASDALVESELMSTASGLSFGVIGTAAETVRVTMLVPGAGDGDDSMGGRLAGKIEIVDVTLGASGEAIVVCAAGACKQSSSIFKTDDTSAYRVVWDAYWPLSCYEASHADPVDANLSSFGIEANGINSNGSMSAEHGRALTQWSHNPHHRLHNGLGLYPYYSESGTCKFPDPNTCNDTNAVHGGIPQLAIRNLSAHVEKLKADINNPNGCAACGDYSLPANFDGLGVLDWESWSFAWSHMKLQGWTAKTDVRVNKSIELVLADHPGITMAAAEVEAGRRWDRAVQIFVEATLATLHELRPRGKFGVFGYPDCGPQTGYSAPGKPLACSQQFQALNDNELSWLWPASSALFPGYYISAPPGQYARANVTYDSNRRGVDTTVAEAVRVAQSAPPAQRPQVFLYSRASYYAVGFAGKAWAQNKSGLLQQTDLESAIARPAAHGINGLILWGSSEDCRRRREDCPPL